jgi:stalled ribosome rescue protein Dom34
VKRRFQVALKKQLRDSVVSEAQIGDELEEIKRFFPKIAQDGE